MDTLIDFALKEKYSEISKRKNKLQEVHNLIDWEFISNQLPSRVPEKAGRRPISHKAMIKTLVLQAWHTLSDEETEYQCYNRLDFQRFLNSSQIPDARTIWAYREWLIENNLIDSIWNSIKAELIRNKIELKEGKIQDATFVEAPPGKTDSGMARRGRSAKTSRSKDGSWTKKNNKSIFGFKSHTKVDVETKMIDEVAVTTAKTHDNRIDLAKENEVCFKDRGYSGSNTKAKGDGTMKKGKLNIRQKMRNKRITKTRCRGEHPYATIKKGFKGGTTALTTLPRVFAQQVMVCIAYNLHKLEFITRSG
jgi:IS5 family transposase